MGGGASSAAAEQMEEMIAYSTLLSKTITCMTFPGMHSIKDFNLLPKKDTGASTLKKREESGRSTTATDSFSRTSSGSEGPPPLLDPELEDKFTVVVDGEVIVLDDVTQQARQQNEDGWTPLHACCHSATTAAIGLRILEEVVAMGGDLNLRTTSGPGNFNSGFTPLHMACAYGVKELVEALIKAGADPNCRNDFDWGPLLEVCHRGFAAIAALLVRAGADVAHVPDAKASCGAHIMRGAPQSALGAAARGGFQTICKMLLENGSDKDQPNGIGWTPLHEACYFNHLDTVQLLLVHGADPTIKNVQGAMPYNMTSFQPIRDLLREIGGEEAAKTMPTPTFSVCVNEQGQMFVRVTAGKEEEKAGGEGSAGGAAAKKASSPSRSRSPQGRAGNGGGGPESGEVLHKGPMLGELPALGRPPVSSSSGGASPTAYDSKLNSEERRHDGAGVGGRGGGGTGDGAGVAPGLHETSRDSNSLGMPGETDEGQAPKGIICQLSKRVARDPVRTPYGHLFDRQMIGLWLSKQGSICPLTGQPLVEAELKADGKAKAEAKAWNDGLVAQKKRSATATSAGRGGPSSAAAANGGRSKTSGGREGEGQMAKESSTVRGKADAAAAVGAEGRGSSSGGERNGADLETPAPAKDAAAAAAAARERRGSKEAENDGDDIYDF
ncbi:unnamed protein product [Ectocarpus sp. 13 AM-2016]